MLFVENYYKRNIKTYFSQNQIFCEDSLRERVLVIDAYSDIYNNSKWYKGSVHIKDDDAMPFVNGTITDETVEQ